MYENEFSFTRLFKAYGRVIDFGGRSTRSELLGYLISVWLLATAANWATIALLVSPNDGLDPDFALMAINLALLSPMPGLAVRRSHDIGRPGAWALLLIVPWVTTMVFGAQLDAYPVLQIISSVTYLGGLVALFWKPQEEENRYGPNPRLIDDRWTQVQ